VIGSDEVNPVRSWRSDDKRGPGLRRGSLAATRQLRKATTLVFRTRRTQRTGL